MVTSWSQPGAERVLHRLSGLLLHRRDDVAVGVSSVNSTLK